jgi:hypothetical protein
MVGARVEVLLLNVLRMVKITGSVMSCMQIGITVGVTIRE